MSDNIKQIVSMLASENKITLFTLDGVVLDMKNDGPHNTTEISEFLVPQLSGGNVVEINLSDYLAVAKALTTPEYEEDGIVVTHMVNGKEVQGIFYPQKTEITVDLDDGQEPVSIPKVENLEKHINRASDEKSPAVRNFLKRLAPVVRDRRHSAEDLMAFIERSEMPLTNDGMIIAYKRVRKSDTEGTFVDCHSGKITQRVGSRVWMEIDAVDPDRNRSCSHGLHVANFGYLGGFSGSDTLVCIVDPAHFIAVPHGETTKARVMEYHVVGHLDGNAHSNTSRGNTHIEGNETFEALISRIVAGEYAPPFESVKVGTKKVLEILPMVESLEGDNQPVQPEEVEEVIADIVESVVEDKTPKPSGKSLMTDETPEPAEKKDIVKMAKRSKAAASGKNLWDNAPAEVITAFDALRVGNETKTAIARAAGTSTRSLQRWQEKYDYDGYCASRDVNMTVTERARDLYNRWIAGTVELAELVGFKKSKKKGWGPLGFNSKEETRIVKAMKAT